MYSAILLLDPNLVAALGNRGIAYGQLGRHAEARRDFELAHKLSPTDPTHLSNLGLASFNEGEWEAAMRFYDEALRLAPAHATAIYNKACLLAREGKNADALHWLQRVAELDREYLTRAAYDPDFDNLHGDPGFQALIATV